jgi:acetyl-CoA carboxylase carboxyltransferase component
MSFETMDADLSARRRQAMTMGGEKKLAQRHAEGLLDARQRIARLLDEDSFVESGLLATSDRPEMRDRTPADGKVTGFGKIKGRMVGVASNDFTVMGASSTRTNGHKIDHVKEVATRRGFPMIFLGESTGARMPDIMGARGIGSGDARAKYLRRRESPWVSAVLGPCYGSSSWYAALSDFVVMRKGAVMAVASPRLASLATSEEIDPQSLGGWEMHARTTGLVDYVTDTDEEAIDVIKRFLSYMPSHHMQRPPRAGVPAGSDEPARKILDIIPASRHQVYDVRRVITAICDLEATFEIKSRFGRSIATVLGRIDGQCVGFIANNPLVKGGAIDVDACAKVVSFLVLCDSFNIPIVLLVDQPGFLVGLQGEAKGAVGKVMNWMNALSLVTVPKISIVMRKSYGQSHMNMGGSRTADDAAAWTTAEVSFMEPEFGAAIVHGVRRDGDPEAFEHALQEMSKETSAYDLASIYATQAVIDPRETRDYLKRILAIHERRPEAGIGEHLMHAWPTSF